MMSLSKFARSAPRAALRTATPSIRQTPFASSIRSKISQQTPRLAAFSTSQWRSDSCRPKLTLKLDSELQIEREESSRQSGSDQAIEEFKNDNPSWTIEDVEGEQEVFLRKKFEDEDVTVYFNIADFNNDMDAYENDMDNAISDEDLDMDTQSHGANSKGAVNQGQTKGGNFKVAPEDGVTPADREELADDEDAETPQQFPVSITVLVQRANKGALKFYLTAADGEFNIQQVVQLPKDIKGDYKELLRNNHEHLYAGPPFQQLDEELQTLFEEYLQGRGVSEYLANVLPDYIDVKEQKEYVAWLQRVKSFVE